jgi:methylated-DNA-protein-cysteine methyltransferase-like protein
MPRRQGNRVLVAIEQLRHAIILKRSFMLDRMFPKIRAVILKIPKGKVATYGQVATAAGFPGAARQVVWALRSARGLPWHRVLGAGGKIYLPGEPGFEQKMRLSNEGVTFRGERVRMDLHQHEFRKKAAARAKRNVKKL